MATNYGVKFKSARERLQDLLWDLQWHHRRELEREAGNRYAARVLELKRLGFVVESREIPNDDGKAYRLVSRTPGAPQEKRVKVFLDELDADAIVHGRVTTQASQAVQDALGSFRANRTKL